ncbi:TolC family protein [Hyalangium minutum]|uniref:Outer membrane efflux protein n=1 Tax=Hyalangium minutum TaxID=394096 RepID=A0A085WPL4_9BACT|nr:TolC family protein [Hyalangium minutum]KFE69627.1 outer membrane efflux protein [Hyalangium minutum]
MNALLLAALLAVAPQSPAESNATPATPATPDANASSVSLAEARAEGRRNTQALLSLLDVERAEADVRSARSPLLPQVDFSLSAGGVKNGPQRIVTPVCDPTGTTCVQQTVDVPGNSRGNYNASVGLSQIIYDRARWKQLEQSGASAEATRGQAVEQADAAELEAVNRFFNLYRSQATIQVLDATVRRSEEQLERARALFHAGRVGRGEELSALVNLGNDRINLVQRRAQLVQDQGQLAIWLARPGSTALVAQDPGIFTVAPEPAPALDAAMREARQRRPLLRALQEQVRAAQLGEDVAASGYFPRLVGQGSYSRGGPNAGPVFTEPRLQNAVSGQLVLQWDLFNGFATQAQEARAAATRRTAELNLAQAERELDASVRAAIETLQTRIDAARLASENREAAAQSLTLGEERFKAGAGSTLEVRDAQLKLTQAELTLLGNRIDVEVARFALMRAMGTLSPGESK